MPAAILTGIGALILLDADESAVGVKFSSLSAEEANAVGLSLAEWRAYERERVEISTIAEQSVVDAERVVGSENLQSLIFHIRANWERDASVLLSSDAAAAARKIAQSSIRQP